MDARNATAGVAGLTETKEIRPLSAIRAFGVTIGGSVVLLGGLASCLGATASSLLSRRRPPLPALAGLGIAAAYVAVVRPRHLRWGAEPGDLERSLPGDEFLPEAGTRILHAVSIEAPAEEVWPWLAQIGQDRGGFYSYEWLENLAGCRMRNAETVHPEWQRREVGETVFLHPGGGLEVTLFEPGHAIGLRNWGTFVLEPRGPRRSRLLVRGGAPAGLAAAAFALLMEIPHFVMERRMLRGIKQRAERGPGAPLSSHPRRSAVASAVAAGRIAQQTASNAPE